MNITEIAKDFRSKCKSHELAEKAYSLANRKVVDLCLEYGNGSTLQEIQKALEDALEKLKICLSTEETEEKASQKFIRACEEDGITPYDAIMLSLEGE